MRSLRSLVPAIPTPLCFACLLALLVLLALVAAPARAAEPGPAAAPEGRLLRFPDIHGDTVVFVYGGDLWRAPSAGGPAMRLTAHPGQELFPKISQDGAWIAYTAEYTGSRQVYVMPLAGGEPKQLTYYTDVGAMPPRGGFDNWVMDWTKDGRILVRMNRTAFGERMGTYFLVDPKGGLERPLPLPHGGSASFDPAGTKLAYTPIDREFRTWKRTRGGRAQDIWIYDLVAARSERVTDNRVTDNFPMWIGDAIYFTSDRDDTLNLYAYDLKTKATRKLTQFTEFDVLWPAAGPGAIVFMNGGYLYRYDLASGQAAKIPIALGAEQPYALPAFKAVAANVGGATLSPSGARVAFDARGDLFTVPAKDGATRALFPSQGVRERAPAWSSDGKTIAYLSDRTGEYEIYLANQDGSGTPRQLTKGAVSWYYAPAFSPDGKLLAFADRQQRLLVVDVASGEVTVADTSDQEDLVSYAWSPDSRWLAYEKSHPNRMPGIAVWSVEQKRSFFLGDGATMDSDPTFSADGKYLFFTSLRDFNFVTSAFEFDYLYRNAGRVYAAALDPSADPLFPLKSDEEKGKAEEPKKDAAGAKSEEKKGEGKKAGEKPAEPKPPATTIVPDGFVARTIALPGLPAGEYGNLAAVPGYLYYVRNADGGARALYRFDLKERKEEKVLDNAGGYLLTADGKKLLYRQGPNWGLTDAKAGLAGSEGKLDLSGLRVKLDPWAEWQQMFTDGWRITRDWFYDPGMHGYDWKALYERYSALVPFVAHRAEVDWLLGEMMSELEAGHTYVAPGDEPAVARVEGGMLGAELVADPGGRYRIDRIYQGENWDEAWRGPLSEPGVNVKEGEFLVAIDGVDLTTADNPYRLLEGKANRQVVLSVNGKPATEGARQVTVRTIDSELNLRYLDWVRARMALADKLSGGKVGYIHLPNTAGEGNRMLQKMFYAQVTKPALIVDDRYNGGGFIPVRMIDYLERNTMAWWARRNVEAMRSPGFAHDGPKAMLMNGYSSSGGDALPYWFKARGLGPLIGTRTWGGLIGLSGNPALVDGGAVQVPTFRIYDAAGQWVIENEGVEPDIWVDDLPEVMMQGGDPSVEKAVEVLLLELAKSPPREPKQPAPPDLAPPALKRAR